VDVIESQFSILLNNVENTRDFEAIRIAHDHFLSSLLSQCFIHMKQVRQKVVTNKQSLVRIKSLTTRE